MPRIPIAPPRWNALAVFGLVSFLSACSDDGMGPPDDPLDEDLVAFLLESLTLGNSHTCGLTTQGKAYCWGSNEYGQLGDGTTTNDSTPVAVKGDLTFRTLDAGGLHTCGMTTDGAIYCWGRNNNGQLGDGTTSDRPVPTRVVGGPQLLSLSLGSGYTCGLTAVGSAYCWGWNVFGQFGNGKVMVEGACALHDGRPPENLYCTSPLPAAGALTLRSLEPGSWHTCGLALEGTVYCWGRNANGLVGDGATTDRLTPVPVASDRRYADLYGGSTYACALRSGGEADCWGHLPWDYLQDNFTSADSVLGATTPGPVAPGLKFLSVSVGGGVACGLADDGTAHCWGDRLHGALGDGRIGNPNNANDRPRMTPAPVLGERKFETVAASWYRACGLTAEGVAYCWGMNDYGQLGDGTTQDRAEPVMVRAAR
jgi:hypothetical protein